MNGLLVVGFWMCQNEQKRLPICQLAFKFMHWTKNAGKSVQGVANDIFVSYENADRFLNNLTMKK